MVYGTQITIVTGANLNQLITGGPHIVVSPHSARTHTCNIMQSCFSEGSRESLRKFRSSLWPFHQSILCPEGYERFTTHLLTADRDFILQLRS